MKRIAVRVSRAAMLALISSLVLIPMAGQAQVPQTISYQGSLTDSGGAPVTGPVAMTFGLYAVAAGGTALWAETQTVSVANGVFDVVLGADAGSPLPAAIFESPLWLGVAVDTDAEMTPRQALAAAGYGIRAKTVEVDSLSGLACLGTDVPKWNGSAWFCAADIDTDTQLSEAEVETFVTNGALDLAAGTTLSGAAIQTGSEADTLGGLACGSGEVAKWNGAAWACAADADTADTTLSEAQVETFVTNTAIDLAAGSSVAGQGILTSVDWTIVTGIPAGFADSIDDDTLGGLVCLPGQVAKLIGGAWTCAVDDISGGIAADLACAGCVAETELGFDTANQTELNLHAGAAAAHHSRYTNAEAVAAVGPHVTSVDGLSGGTIGGAVAVKGTVSAEDLAVASTVLVPNLNADRLDDLQAAEIIDAAADEVRTPIDALPFTISAPGSYYLTGDLSIASTSEHGITVDADNVTIDLMGYSVVGPGSGFTHGIRINGRTNVEVRNGTVREFYIGIFETITAAGSGHRVIDLRAVSNGNRGIYLEGQGHVVKDSTAANNGSHGIESGTASTLVGNTVYGNTGYGILGGSGNTVTGNMAYNNGNIGIRAGLASTVSGNTSVQNGAAGFQIGPASTVTGNTAYENATRGISVSAGVTVRGNTAYFNGTEGIYLSGNDFVDGNTAVFNDQSTGGHANISTCTICTFGTNHAPP
jgi:parallel beta-helix repeat protein